MKLGNSCNDVGNCTDMEGTDECSKSKEVDDRASCTIGICRKIIGRVSKILLYKPLLCPHLFKYVFRISMKLTFYFCDGNGDIVNANTITECTGMEDTDECAKCGKAYARRYGQVRFKEAQHRSTEMLPPREDTSFCNCRKFCDSWSRRGYSAYGHSACRKFGTLSEWISDEIKNIGLVCSVIVEAFRWCAMWCSIVAVYLVYKWCGYTSDQGHTKLCSRVAQGNKMGKKRCRTGLIGKVLWYIVLGLAVQQGRASSADHQPMLTADGDSRHTPELLRLHRPAGRGGHKKLSKKQAKFQLRVVTVNTTAWRPAQEFLELTDANVVLVQEHKLIGAQVAEASIWADRNGWRSILTMP